VNLTFEQAKDLIAILSPLVVLVVTLAFTSNQNRRQRESDRLQRIAELRGAAYAAVIAEVEKFEQWQGSEHIQLYEGPDFEPWDIEHLVSPLRAAIAQAEMVCSPGVRDAGASLLQTVIDCAADPTNPNLWRPLADARAQFVNHARSDTLYGWSELD